MWEISLKQQVISFLFALLVGFVWALFFDFFRALRKAFIHSGLLVFAEDLFCFLIFTFVTFMLLMARCNGEVRGYMLVGEALGFAFYRLTLSRFIMSVLVFLFSLLGKFFAVSGEWIERFGTFLEKNTGKLWQNFKKIIKKLKVMRKNS